MLDSGENVSLNIYLSVQGKQKSSHGSHSANAIALSPLVHGRFIFVLCRGNLSMRELEGTLNFCIYIFLFSLMKAHLLEM